MADYLFGSANIRTLENAIIGRERIERLLNTKTTDEAWALLADWGVNIIRNSEDGSPMREETLLGILKGAYDRLTELAPDSDALRLWLYPYDCNNLKAAQKAFIRGIDPTSMLFDFGTVSALNIVKMVETGNYEGLPANLQASAQTAMDEYAKTKNPQVIDLILDKACWRDMLNAAKASGEEFVIRLVETRIDLLNTMIALRILRMKSGEVGKVLFAEAFLEGGKLARERMIDCMANGEDALLVLLRYSDYSRFAENFAKSDGALSTAEKLADNYWMSLILENRFVPMGLEVMVAFMAAHEYEVKNLRILLSGKEAGISVATIRERIRDSYV
ncbi:MAG: V-type ATPase subunit [Clostridia bacterium]|nr:V-type ATPase subunit [Clostridia bacterium]